MTSDPSKRRSRSRQGTSNRTKQLPTALPRGRTHMLRSEIPKGRYIVFDIETTGGNPERSGITEIFALKFHNGKAVDTFYSMVNPEVPIPSIVRKMTGITNQMVRGAPTIREVMPVLYEFLGDDVLVSHNTIGDLKFLRYYADKVVGETLTNYFLCTHLLTEKLLPDAPDKSLKGAAEYLGLNFVGDWHRAEADAYLTLELFKGLITKLSERQINKIEDAVRFQGDYESGLRLGWSIGREHVEQLPNSPGVFTLLDIEKKPVFSASVISMRREVERLRDLGKLPRPLLKAVLCSRDLKYQQHVDPLAADLEEVDKWVQSGHRFNPAAWHGRVGLFLRLYKRRGGNGDYALGLGPLDEEDIAAIGPLKSSAVGTEILEQVGSVLELDLGKKGMVLDNETFAIVIQWLHGGMLTKSPLLKRFLSRDGVGARPRGHSPVLDDLWRIPIPIKNKTPKSTHGLLVLQMAGTVFCYAIVGGVPEEALPMAGRDFEPPKEYMKTVKRRVQMMKTLNWLQGRQADPRLVAVWNRMGWWLTVGVSRGIAKFYSLDDETASGETGSPAPAAETVPSDES